MNRILLISISLIIFIIGIGCASATEVIDLDQHNEPMDFGHVPYVDYQSGGGIHKMISTDSVNTNNGYGLNPNVNPFFPDCPPGISLYGDEPENNHLF